jgi:hypothetical protein
VWDRYDVRENHRDHDDPWDRNFGSRGGTGEGNRNDEGDPREVFTKDLDLPRSRERRSVRERDRVYEINGTESRMLATVGAFRVVSERDLHDGRDDTRRAQRHLEREGLLRTSPLSSDDRAIVLTDRGRDLLEANRYERHERSWEPRQAFYAGLRKPRELTHDSNIEWYRNISSRNRFNDFPPQNPSRCEPVNVAVCQSFLGDLTQFLTQF